MEDRTIRPNILFSGAELVQNNKELLDYQIVAKGRKFEEYDQSREEFDVDIERSNENLRRLLKLERISIANKRSKGVYEPEKNRVKTSTMLGKFGWFGYMEDNTLYLKPHEALLLIEMNRLEVTFNGVIMSLEQAYAIFLARCELSFKEYYVFSNLTRIGYGVLPHNLESDRQKHAKNKEINKVKKEDDMIWCVLSKSLNLPFSRDLIRNDRELYLKTKANLQKHFTAISGIENPNMEWCDNNGDDEDNKKSIEPPSKKSKASSSPDRNFLDILKSDLQYLTYEEIFKKFSFIKRKSFADESCECGSGLKFSFDVFLPKAHFKRSEELAAYRVVIISSTDSFPTHSQLEALRRQQAYEVPIIIATISEHMSLHYSVCIF